MYGVNGGVPTRFQAGIPLTALGQVCISNGLLKTYSPPSQPITLGDTVRVAVGGTPTSYNYGQGFNADGLCTELI